MNERELMELFLEETDDLQSIVYALEDGAFLASLGVDQVTVENLHDQLVQMLDN